LTYTDPQWDAILGLWCSDSSTKQRKEEDGITLPELPLLPLISTAQHSAQVVKM
jgi:hypothetical protein